MQPCYKPRIAGAVQLVLLIVGSTVFHGAIALTLREEGHSLDRARTVLAEDPFYEDSDRGERPAGDVVPKHGFDTIWQSHYTEESREREQHFTGGMSVVIAVPTYAKDHQHRHVVEETWFNQSGVCKLLDKDGQAPSEPVPGCSVYVVWLVALEPDNSSLPGELHMNLSSASEREGLLYEYYRWATREVPWATHIGKSDMDNYPYLHRILRALSEQKPKRHQMLGSCMNPIGYEHCRKLSPSCSNKGRWDIGNCCLFWQGGCYIMSMDLARIVSVKGGVWDSDKVGPEDLQLGHAINTWASRTGKCYTKVLFGKREIWNDHLFHRR